MTTTSASFPAASQKFRAVRRSDVNRFHRRETRLDEQMVAPLGTGSGDIVEVYLARSCDTSEKKAL
jgi:hypothetical protein